MVNVHVARSAGGEGSGNFLVVAKVEEGLGFRRRNEKEQCKEVIRVSELSERAVLSG